MADATPEWDSAMEDVAFGISIWRDADEKFSRNGIYLPGLPTLPGYLSTQFVLLDQGARDQPSLGKSREIQVPCF